MASDTRPVPRPPAHLSARSRRLWREVARRVNDPGRLALLQTALESLDRADQAREEIAAAGMTTTTRASGCVHVHPLVKVENASRFLFVTAWQQLGLHRREHQQQQYQPWGAGVPLVPP
jgi:phage terminase small subunit